MEQILRLFLGYLAEYIIAFLRNLKAARADNPALWTTATMIVEQISAAHPDWSGEQKKSYAFDAIKVAWRELMKDVGQAAVGSLPGRDAGQVPEIPDSTVNMLIEMAVQRLRNEAHAVASPPHMAGE